MYFLRDSLSPSPSSLGAILKGQNLLLWGANSFKSTPKFEVIQLAPLKKRINMIFFNCQRVWKTVK